MPRLFVALPIPEEMTGPLERLETMLPGVRWLEPAQWHLTLRFLGEVPGRRVEEIAQALARVPAEPFALTLRGVGHFPPRGEPKSLWVGIEPSTPLKRLKRAIDAELRDELEIEPDRRAFVPHVTIARIQSPPPTERFGAFWRNHSLFRAGPFAIERFALYSSQLRPGGSVYTVEAMYELLPEMDDAERFEHSEPFWRSN